MNPVKYCANAQERLLSIPNEMSHHGAKLSSNDRCDIILTYPNGDRIVLDRRIKTKNGWVPGIDVISNIDKIAIMAKSRKPSTRNSIKSGQSTKIDINEFHRQLGHPSFDSTRATAKAQNITLTGTQEQCEACAQAKSQQKRTNKETIPRSEIPAERFFIDISSPKTTSLGGAKHWLLVLDDCTDCAFSFFLKSKNQQKEKLISFIQDVRKRTDKEGFKHIRCDNAGENITLDQQCKKLGLGVNFEYMAPKTPQQNGCVERKFATLYGRIRAMLLASGLEKPLRQCLWAECANTATQLANHIIPPKGNTSPFHQFFGKGVKSFIDSTKTFGEMCIVANRQQIKAKFDDRGKPCIWLGYAENHAAGTYRVLKTLTEKVNLTRDVTFLRKSYGNWVDDQEKLSSIPNSNDQSDDEDEDEDEDELPPLVPPGNYVSDDEDESDEEDEEEGQNSSFHTAKEANQSFQTAFEEKEDDSIFETPSGEFKEASPPNPCLYRAMKELESAFLNPEATNYVTSNLNAKTNMRSTWSSTRNEEDVANSANPQPTESHEAGRESEFTKLTMSELT